MIQLQLHNVQQFIRSIAQQYKDKDIVPYHNAFWGFATMHAAFLLMKDGQDGGEIASHLRPIQFLPHFNF